MHIRHKNQRIVFIRSWWSAELKKTIRKQIASCHTYCTSLPDTVRTRAGGDTLREVPVETIFEEREIEQANDWFEEQRQKQDERDLELAPWALSRNLDKVTQLVKDRGIDGISEEQAFVVLEKIVALELELKRSGVNKGKLKERMKKRDTAG